MSHFFNPRRTRTSYSLQGSLGSLVLGTTLITAALAGPAGAQTSYHALDPSTDVAVTLVSPKQVSVGQHFEVSLRLNNYGSAVARSVVCGVSEPRPGAVNDWSSNVPTVTAYDPVEGNASREFTITSITPGQSVAVTFTGTANATGPRDKIFQVLAFCAPRPVDKHQSNNVAESTIVVL
jgi:Domain of unknown function DUF11